MEDYELQVVDTKKKNERKIISDFVIPNHLTASCRNEIELEAQTKDLETDFPDLYSDSIFEKGYYWKIEQDGKIIGGVGLTPYKEDHIIYLSFLGVSESARGKGIGRKLLEVAIKTAKEKNYKAIRLCTLPEVFLSACHLYYSYGFKEFSGERTPIYYVSIFELIL